MATLLMEPPFRRSLHDDDEQDGRVLGLAEYVGRLCNRPDIFGCEREPSLRNAESVCLAMAIGVGVWLASRELIDVGPDYFGSSTGPTSRET